MKRFFLSLLIIFVVLLLSVVGGVYYLLSRPHLTIDNHLLVKARPYLSRFNFDLRWKDGRIDIQSEGLLNKYITLNVSDVCFRMDTSVKVDTCFDEARVQIHVDGQNKQKPLQSISHIYLANRFLHIELPTSNETEPAPEKNLTLSQQIAQYAKYTKSLDLSKIYIASHDVSIKTPTSHWLVDATLQDEAKNEDQISAILRAKVVETEMHLKVDTRLRLNGGNDLLLSAFDLTGPLNLDVPSVHLASRLKVSSKGGFPWAYDVSLSMPNPHIRTRLRGTLTDDGTAMLVTGRIMLGTTALFTNANPCRLNVAFKGEYTTTCPLNIKLGTQPRNFKPFPAIPFQVTADLKSMFPPSPSQKWSGRLSLDAPRVRYDEYEASLKLGTQIEDTFLDRRLFDTLKIDTDLNLQVNDFAKLVTRLDEMGYGVPAPLNALKGKILLTSQGNMSPTRRSLPVHVQSDLKSPEQIFNLIGDGTLALQERGPLKVLLFEADVLLDRVRIKLPELALKTPPAVIPDSRIHKEQVAKTSNFRFEYNVQIQTPQGRPLELISNLAQAPVPIGLNLRLASDSPVGGYVAVQEFPVDLFRRNARVKFFNLTLGRKDERVVSGQAEMKYIDYNIFMRVSGPVSSPHVELTSDPYLDQDQVFALVIFGRPLAELSADQLDSVGSARAAFLNSAVSLASLYFLASTPIESVGYSSKTGVFTAKVRLDEGVSLDVGSNFDKQSEVGINKRLGNSWYVRTLIDNPVERERRSASAILEWVTRY